MRPLLPLHHALHRQVSIAPLVTLRIMLGLLLSVSTIRFILLGWVEDHYLQPVFHFSYFGFEWLPRVKGIGLYVIHFLMLAASLMVMLGWYYRVSALLLFLLFTYTELYDLTYYLNHYYFVSLVCLLLIFVPANRAFSVDVIRNPSLFRAQVPQWAPLLFKLQIIIVYFFAGIAKINYDWLVEALPLRIWLPPNEHLPLIGPLFTWHLTPWLFSWAGMLFDVSIPIWLLWNRTRPVAYLMVLLFHGLTGILFQIGVFPLVMMGATLIFFSDAWHQNWQNSVLRFLSGFSLSNNRQADQTPKNQLASPWLVTTLVLFYVSFQLLFPLRFIFYPGNLFWTEEGYRFGWRVMLMEKAGTATFFVKDTCTGKEGVVINSDFLNDHQEKQMAMQPDMIIQYAHFLAREYKSQGMCAPEVRAEIWITLNGQRGKLLFDPDLILNHLEDSWKPKTWLNTYAAS
jgi:hypothetical protein